MNTRTSDGVAVSTERSPALPPARSCSRPAAATTTRAAERRRPSARQHRGAAETTDAMPRPPTRCRDHRRVVGSGDILAFDANGDGEVVIGIAAAGPRDDGAYYQAVVEAAEHFSAENGFGELIVVDNIDAADAATDLANLAQQGVDIIIVGASEIAEPLPDLAEQYPDIFWYCNCGAGFPETPGLPPEPTTVPTSTTPPVYATGLRCTRRRRLGRLPRLLRPRLRDRARTSRSSSVSRRSTESFTMTYVPTGDFPFDFDNIAERHRGLQNAVDEGADAVYPYLGGAHEPVVQLANEAGLITMSAGASDVCTREETSLGHRRPVRRWRLRPGGLPADRRRLVQRGRHHRLLRVRTPSRCGDLRRHPRAAGRDGRCLRPGRQRRARRSPRRIAGEAYGG